MPTRGPGRLVVVAALVVLAGCCKPESPASAADAALQAAVDPADAGPPPPLRLDVRATAIMPDGELPLPDPDGAVVALESRFVVELPPIPGLRVRLFDSTGRLVASRDRQIEGRTARYELTPQEPLEPGSRYVLVVDGLRANAVGPAGRPIEPARIHLRTREAEPKAQPAAVKPSKKGKKRRSRR